MAQAVSCGGVVIRKGKVLLLYKNFKNRYDGWVMPKGTVEAGEEFSDTALREVQEEAGISASIVSYIGKSRYSFNTSRDTIAKEVHWYLMSTAETIQATPQTEEGITEIKLIGNEEVENFLKNTFRSISEILAQELRQVATK